MAKISGYISCSGAAALLLVSLYACARILERLPQRGQQRLVGVGAGAEARLVPVGQRAGRRVRGQIGAQPSLLGRSQAATL